MIADATLTMHKLAGRAFFRNFSLTGRASGLCNTLATSLDLVRRPETGGSPVRTQYTQSLALRPPQRVERVPDVELRATPSLLGVTDGVREARQHARRRRVDVERRGRRRVLRDVNERIAQLNLRWTEAVALVAREEAGRLLRPGVLTKAAHGAVVDLDADDATPLGFNPSNQLS